MGGLHGQRGLCQRIIGWGGACVIVSIFVLEVCTSVQDECGVPWVMVLAWGGACVLGGLVIFFFSKMLQLSPRLNSAGR